MHLVGQCLFGGWKSLKPFELSMIDVFSLTQMNPASDTSSTYTTLVDQQDFNVEVM